MTAGKTKEISRKGAKAQRKCRKEKQSFISDIWPLPNGLRCFA
jgi:hypothetical protein